jgi:hypothetical protein
VYGRLDIDKVTLLTPVQLFELARLADALMKRDFG